MGDCYPIIVEGVFVLLSTQWMKQLQQMVMAMLAVAALVVIVQFLRTMDWDTSSGRKRRVVYYSYPDEFDEEM
eukprot:6588985-Pyramimonas_sp.AAC.1